jgi:hypothetical protein
MAVVPALQYMLITGDELLTDKQRAWRDMKRISASFRPLPLQTRPPNKLQACLTQCPALPGYESCCTSLRIQQACKPHRVLSTVRLIASRALHVPPQGRCYDAIHWRHFPALVVAVVLLNTMFQMTSWAAEPRGWHTALEVSP